jgi:hypothetical protein
MTSPICLTDGLITTPHGLGPLHIPERPEHRKERVETDLTHLVALAFSTQGHAEGFLTGLQTLAPAELLANVTCSVGVRKVGTCISAVKGTATIDAHTTNFVQRP